jgi:hypothetical protein
MTTKEKFFESVDRICEVKNLPDVAIAVKSLYEATVDPNDATMNQVDLSKLSEEQVAELQGDVTKVAEAKKAADTADENLKAVNAETAAKANAAAAQAEQEEEQKKQQEGV